MACASTPSTKTRDGAGASATVGRAISPSLPTIHDCQKGHRADYAHRALSRGRGRDWSGFARAGFMTFPLNLAGADPSRSFPVSHWRAVLLPCCADSRATFLPLGSSGTYSPSSSRANGNAAHLASKPQSQTLAYLAFVHHSNVLSSSLSSRWVDPNEIGLTNAQGSFAPGAKDYD